MNHTYYKPNKLLAEYVRTILIMDGCSEPAPGNLPIFTNGMPTLFCKTETSKTSTGSILQVTLFGNGIPPECFTINNTTTIIAYFFKPFALASLFKISAKEVAKNSLDLCNWSPHKYNALKTQLVYADTVGRKIEVLDNLLIQQRIENSEVYEIIQYATDTIIRNPANDILAEILAELKLNERTFQRIFKKYVGVTPTQYRRISQFQLSFEQLRSHQFSKTSEVAFDNGFADQSHFIRSFKEFTHTTPNDYLQNGLAGKKL
jgi:AraC-like DNA-binding protein